MTAPDRLCPPQVFAFSITATGTSPSFSIVSGSSASSCNSRLAQLRPAVPPPTIATPISMRSSSASRLRLTNSPWESTGGGKAAGATFPFPFAEAMGSALSCLDRLCELRQDRVQVPDDAEVAELEDRSVRVLVDGHDVLRRLHAHLVLDRARDAGREVELRRDRLAGLADLSRVGVPTGVDDRTGRRDGTAERARELLAELEALGLAEATPAGHQQLGVLDVHVGATLLAALDHLGLRRVVLELEVDVDHLGRAATALDDVERVEAADDDARLADVVDVDDRRVLEDRALGYELAALGPDVRDLHRHAGVEASGQSRTDLEAEQPAAEQRVGDALVLDDLGHRVDDRLRQALGNLGTEDLRRAVAAQRRAEVVGQVVATDDDDSRLATDLLGELGTLGDGAERVLVEGALVVERVGQDPAHASSFLSSSQLTIFSTVSLVSSSSMISPADLAGGGLIARTAVREPSWPTLPASMPASPVDLVSSGFFFAPMIAFSDG